MFYKLFFNSQQKKVKINDLFDINFSVSPCMQFFRKIRTSYKYIQKYFSCLIRYFWLRFGLINTIDNYLNVENFVLYVKRSFNFKCLLIKFGMLNKSQIYFCLHEILKPNV